MFLPVVSSWGIDCIIACLLWPLSLGAGFPVCPGPSRAEEAAAITKPPHLVHFVPAEYPKDKHDAGITARVLLSIEIGDDGKVGEVEVVESAGADFDSAAVAAARAVHFHAGRGRRASHSGQDHLPLRLHYRDQDGRHWAAGELRGRDSGSIQEAALADVTVKIKDLDLATKTDADGAFAFTDLPPGTHKVEIRHPRLSLC